MKNIIKITVLALLLTGCDDLFNPAIENNLGFEYMYENAEYAEGVLSNAYKRIPCDSYSFSEVATDDAVSNDVANNYRKMAAGSWKSDNNPTERWRNCNAGIMYMNLFLANTDKVHWAEDPIAAEMYNDRMKGEAYGMRAMFMYYLLQAHGGWTADGQLLGVPIVTEPEDASTNFNRPRATFKECMDAIYADLNKALELLPTDYVDVESESGILAKYRGKASLSQYNRVFGVKFRGRFSGRIAEAIRAQASLLAASPSYSEGSGVTWQTAAEHAAVLLNRINGVSGMAAKGGTWYNDSNIGSLKDGECPPEIIWRGIVSNNNSLEQDHYPPSIYGKGRINPTQNLVDAFPMVNGYPISASGSNYDAANPYNNRDPRLSAYILYNGMKAGSGNTVINTAADGNTNDALNKEEGYSTRTGYYLRKLLNQDINLEPNVNSTQNHYKARIRYTEMYLIYAEAANEAYGPTAGGGNSYSAYDVVKALRARAGIGADNGDAYLESVKNDKDKMRELIRNERRLELCFEDFRFWDLRRWKANLNEEVKGVSITGSDPLNYATITVDSREFKDYMYHGPVPYSELLKFNELKQNKGW
ncbi:RagB/SusD family nutrient uptake outer membrane protein [Bacteroides sp. OttesenSCG-928-J23]|nr:RagB/SusD family nutrient uptake outer membrane protein [Bacteroides sp. OttesenSCG-928-J23]